MTKEQEPANTIVSTESNEEQIKKLWGKGAEIIDGVVHHPDHIPPDFPLHDSIAQSHPLSD